MESSISEEKDPFSASVLIAVQIALGNNSSTHKAIFPAGLCDMKSFIFG